eukprot:6067125-Amphidinium_carterae.2
MAGQGPPAKCLHREGFSNCYTSCTDLWHCRTRSLEAAVSQYKSGITFYARRLLPQVKAVLSTLQNRCSKGKRSVDETLPAQLAQSQSEIGKIDTKAKPGASP